MRVTISSMTGFARIGGEAGKSSWSWEIRSVNAKGLDVRVRLPQGFDGMDQAVRTHIAGKLHRGNINLTLTLSHGFEAASYRINEAMLGQVMDILPDIQRRLPDARPPSADGILNVRGVIETEEQTLGETERANLEAAMLGDLDRGVDELVAARQGEGARLSATLQGQMDEIARLVAEAGTHAATRPEAIRARLADQIKALMDDVSGLSEERLAQEAAILMTKADVREELDRLSAHVDEARDLLAAPGAVGRKLDFLCQEFNREANTLCSKSQDVALTRTGLALKAVIEQFREQVQNIE